MSVVKQSSRDDKTELRGLVPTELAQALDAIAMSQGKDRNSLVTEVLDEFVYARLLEMSVVQRALRGNPLLEEASRISSPD